MNDRLVAVEYNVNMALRKAAFSVDVFSVDEETNNTSARNESAVSFLFFLVSSKPCMSVWLKAHPRY